MGKGAYDNTRPRYTGMIGMHGTKASNFGVSRCDLLIVIGVEEDALSKQSSRCLRKLLRNQGNKLLLSTQLIDQTMLKSFEGTLLVSIDHLEMKERRLLFRYLIDMLVSRYFELECA